MSRPSWLPPRSGRRGLPQGRARASRARRTLAPWSGEPLEARTLLTTFTVSNTNDSGAGSLRQAILDANAHAGLDLINFGIGTGTKTIMPASAAEAGMMVFVPVPMPKLIRSSPAWAFASRIAWRSEPAPESLVFETVKVVSRVRASSGSPDQGASVRLARD